MRLGSHQNQIDKSFQCHNEKFEQDHFGSQELLKISVHRNTIKLSRASRKVVLAFT